MRIDTTPKKCNKCDLIKSSGDFYKRKTSHRGSWTYTWCKKCTDGYRKANAGYAAEYAPRRRELRRARREVLEKIIVEHLKQNPCMKCGEKNIITLDFDHRDPKNKNFCVSKAMVNVPSVERLKTEIDKCDILCANCHRVKTAETSGNFKLKYVAP